MPLMPAMGGATSDTPGMTWDPGVELASQRARRGFSLDQAVAATRIRGHFLEALEKGELEAIPAEAYLRGYLRTYATYLGLDPAPLLLGEPVGAVTSAGRRAAHPAQYGVADCRIEQ